VEGKLLTESVNLGVEPLALAVSNDFCSSYCGPLINRMGGTIVTPRLAVFPGLAKIMSMEREGF
jgi:hypothetical protein